MSTTSSVITIAICAILIIALGIALVKGLWAAAKKITLPIQIVLFLVMLTCVVRLFCTKENAQKLYKGIEQSGISQNVENTMRTALKMKPSETPAAEAITKPGRDGVPPPSAAGDGTPALPSSRGLATTSVAEEPDPTPKVTDYSHLDKGRKTFTYALPFNATVTVGFKENTYRVIAESLGSLDASEKKEVGRLIMTSLGKYIGKTINRADKSKITIESQYDESDDHTRVFAIVPPDAIED